MAAPWALALLAIQKVDLRIRDLNTRLSMLPKERRRIADRKKALDAALEEKRAAVKTREMAIKKQENEITGIEQHIDKLQKQSALIKKNAEYQTMMAEIDLCKNRISAIETAVLEGMDQLENTRTALREATAETQAAIRTLKSEWLEFDELEKAVRAEIEAQQKKRVEVAGRIENSLVERYNHLLADGDGMPLAPVENDICGNCSLKLTPQTLTNARRGSVAICDNCGHMVYFEDL